MKYIAAIITASDKGSQGQREDISASVAKEILEKNGYKVDFYKIVPDDIDILEKALIEYCQNGADVIFTTGGTGFSKRDVTPEATLRVIEKRADGITLAMISNSLKITPKAMLSRAVCGIRNNTLIINLPGSPKAVRENLEFIIPHIGHGIDILKGTDSECGQR